MWSLAGSVALHILRVWWCWLKFHISMSVCLCADMCVCVSVCVHVFDCLLAVDAILRSDWSHNRPLVGLPPNTHSGFNNLNIQNRPIFLNCLHVSTRVCVLRCVYMCGRSLNKYVQHTAKYSGHKVKAMLPQRNWKSSQGNLSREALWNVGKVGII